MGTVGEFERKAKSPKVSVLVPVYNIERFLPRCVDSLLTQTLRDIEIICVSDAGSDGSLAILRSYAAKDERIKIIEHQRNEGLMMARRSGYKNACGEYIFFCDSDDYIPADALELLYNAAKCSGAEIEVGEIALRNNSGRLSSKPRHGRVGSDWLSYLKAILDWTTCSLCGSLYKKSLFEDVPYTTFKNQNYSEDRLLLSQILIEKQPSIASISALTYHYCLNSESLTRVRLDEKSLLQQFDALFWSYGYVNRRVSDVDVLRCNRRFIVRYLSLYIERGYQMNVICRHNEDARALLCTRMLFHTLGARLGTHTWLCMKFPGYRSFMHKCRLIIRKIQGKD